jgi:hypothetical protein
MQFSKQRTKRAALQVSMPDTVVAWERVRHSCGVSVTGPVVAGERADTVVKASRHRHIVEQASEPGESCEGLRISSQTG